MTLMSREHKTKGSEGPAFLTMTGTAKEALFFYADNVRPPCASQWPAIGQSQGHTEDCHTAIQLADTANSDTDKGYVETNIRGPMATASRAE